MPDPQEDWLARFRACVDGCHAVVQVADVLRKDRVHACFSDKLGRRGELFMKGLGPHLLKIGALDIRPCVQCRGGDTACYVGIGVPVCPCLDGVVGCGGGVLLPLVAQPDEVHGRGDRPEVVGDDYVRAHAQVVLVHLLDHIGVGDVGSGGPGHQLVGGCASKNVHPSALDLGTGAAVH